MAITPPTGGYCTNCSAPMNANSVACLSCGFAPFTSRSFCNSCARAVNSPAQAMCTGCGSALAGAGPSSGAPGSKSRTTAGILAILLGAFGAHKFYLGRTTPGLVMLAVWVVGFCGGLVIFLPYVACLAVSVVAIIEGVTMLGKSDAEFEREYVVGQKDWF